MASALPQQGRSYFEEFLRARGSRGVKLESEKLVGDRAAYISFLEAQLERVSAACLHTQVVEEKMREQAEQMAAMQEKFAALTQLTQLTQAYTERQGQEAGTAVAALHATITDAVTRTDAQTEKQAALVAQVERLAEGLALAQGRVSVLEGMQSRAQEDTSALAGRVDAIAGTLRVVESSMVQQPVVAQLNRVVEDVDAKVERAAARIAEAVHAVEEARMAAQRAADTAISAEAAAISASEQSRHAASASMAASQDAQRARSAASEAQLRACAADSTATAVLRNMVAASTSAQAPILPRSHGHQDVADAVGAHDLGGSMYMPSPGIDDQANERHLHPAAIPVPVLSVQGSGSVGDGVARVLETVLPHMQQLSQRLASVEVDVARVRATVQDNQQLLSRGLEDHEAMLQREVTSAAAELRSSLAATADDLRHGINRCAERIEEVGAAWTTWEAAFSQSHADAREAAQASARARDNSWAAERDQDRHEAEQQRARLQGAVSEVVERLTAIEAVLLGASPRHHTPPQQGPPDIGGQATGSPRAVLQVSPVAPFSVSALGISAPAPVGSQHASSGLLQHLQATATDLRQQVEGQMEALRAEVETLSSQVSAVDSEHKQLVRATDSLVRRWTEAHSAITELQGHVSELQHMGPGTTAAAPSVASPAGAPQHRTDAVSAVSPVSPPVSHREVVRIVDTIVQPRMQDIAAELHQRLSEELASVSLSSSGLRRSVVGAGTSLPLSAPPTARAASAPPHADAPRSLGEALEQEEASGAVSVGARAAGISGPVAAEIAAWMQADREARDAAMQQLRASVQAAEHACKTVADDAVRTCSQLALETQRLLQSVVAPQSRGVAANLVQPTAKTAAAPQPSSASLPLGPSSALAVGTPDSVQNLLSMVAALVSAQPGAQAGSTAERSTLSPETAARHAGDAVSGSPGSPASSSALGRVIGFPQQIKPTTSVEPQAAHTHRGASTQPPAARGASGAPVRPLSSFKSSPGEVARWLDSATQSPSDGSVEAGRSSTFEEQVRQPRASQRADAVRRKGESEHVERPDGTEVTAPHAARAGTGQREPNAAGAAVRHTRAGREPRVNDADSSSADISRIDEPHEQQGSRVQSRARHRSSGADDELLARVGEAVQLSARASSEPPAVRRAPRVGQVEEYGPGEVMIFRQVDKDDQVPQYPQHRRRSRRDSAGSASREGVAERGSLASHVAPRHAPAVEGEKQASWGRSGEQREPPADVSQWDELNEDASSEARDRIMVARILPPSRPTVSRARMLHESSPGRRLSYRDGRTVISVQTQAGPPMGGHGNTDLHCAHDERRPAVPSRFGRATGLPSWYSQRAAEIKYTPKSSNSSRRSSAVASGTFRASVSTARERTRVSTASRGHPETTIEYVYDDRQ